jgi:hypothetical protein
VDSSIVFLWVPIVGTMALIKTRLCIAEKHWEWLKSEAERRACSVSQVVRDLIVAAMETSSK